MSLSEVGRPLSAAHPDVGPDPPMHRRLVDRPALLRRLDAALDRRLTVVVAGPGYGKTTTLDSWATRHVATWYELRGEDRDLGALTKGLVGALRLRVPDLPATLAAAAETARGPRLDPAEPMRGRAWAALLCQALAE